MNGPARRTSISRRRILQTLSIGGAGMALAGHLPAYAMQAARAAAETPALLPLNRFPRMVQEFFVKRENDIHQQRLERLARSEYPSPRRRVRPDRPEQGFGMRSDRSPKKRR